MTQGGRADHPYYRETTFAATLRGRPLDVVTKPGLPNWERISPAATLLAESVLTAPDARILQLGCGTGALGVALARGATAGHVTLSDANIIATTLAARTLAANRITNATVLEDPATLDAESFDVAVIEIPSGRKFARRWLRAAHAALKRGGTLYLAGPKAEGIASLISDARGLFGHSATLGFRDHNRVAVATKRDGVALPAWAEAPGIAPATWQHFDVTLGDTPTRIASLPGIFSADRLDDGTAFLLAHLDVKPGERVLDIGCGWGAIGLAAAQRGAGAVDLIDSSLPAVAAARRNIATVGHPNARAFPSDALSALGAERYDLIVTNPPFHAGKGISYDAAGAFIAGARDHLTPRGRFLLIANAFIRYERAMRDHFKALEVVAENGRYHLLQGFLRAKHDLSEIA